MIPLEIQLFEFAAMVLTGAAVGFWYELYRAARRAFRWRGLGGELADLGFWLMTAALLIGGLVVGAWGSLRFHVLLGWATGVWLYFALASPWIRSPLLHGLRILRRAGSRFCAFLSHAGKTTSRHAQDTGRRWWRQWQRLRSADGRLRIRVRRPHWRWPFRRKP